MKALLKGEGTIYKTIFTQDVTGGKVENHSPVEYRVPFVLQQTRRFELGRAGKEGVNTIMKMWCETKTNINSHNLTESGWIQFGNNEFQRCFDIQSITQVRSQHGRHGWEIEALERA